MWYWYGNLIPKYSLSSFKIYLKHYFKIYFLSALFSEQKSNLLKKLDYLQLTAFVYFAFNGKFDISDKLHITKLLSLWYSDIIRRLNKSSDKINAYQDQWIYRLASMPLTLIIYKSYLHVVFIATYDEKFGITVILYCTLYIGKLSNTKFFDNTLYFG